MDRRTFIGVSAASLMAAGAEALEAKIPAPIKKQAREDGLEVRFTAPEQ